MVGAVQTACQAFAMTSLPIAVFFKLPLANYFVLKLILVTKRIQDCSGLGG
jgi:hypothetical protein